MVMKLDPSFTKNEDGTITIREVSLVECADDDPMRVRVVNGGETMDKTYKIIRHYQDENKLKEVVAEGLTLEEAQAHCNDPETCYRTCTSAEGERRTKKYGPWFDGYTEE